MATASSGQKPGEKGYEAIMLYVLLKVTFQIIKEQNCFILIFIVVVCVCVCLSVSTIIQKILVIDLGT